MQTSTAGLLTQISLASQSRMELRDNQDNRNGFSRDRLLAVIEDVLSTVDAIDLEDDREEAIPSQLWASFASQ